MNPLSLIPDWLKLIAFGLLLAALGTQTVRLSSEQAAHAKTQASFSDERVAAADAQGRALAEQRDEFERRIGVKDATIQAAQDAAAAARGDAVTARLAGNSLRESTEALVERARAAGWRAGAGAGSAATDDPIGVLADVLGRADQRAGILAEYADASRIAGQACERSYNSLTP